ATGQPEQHRFGLVVASVAKEDRLGPVPLGRRIQGPIASGSGLAFRTSRTGPYWNVNGLDRVEAKGNEHAGNGPGPHGRTVLQAVVDGDRSGGAAIPYCDGGESGRQGERVSTARARH